MTEFFIAWALISLTNIHEFFTGPINAIPTVICAVALFGWCLYTELTDAAQVILSRVTKYLFYWTIILVVSTTLIPSKKDAAYIFGIGMGLKVMNNEQVQKLPENALKIINGYMEESINEAKATKTEEVNK